MTAPPQIPCRHCAGKGTEPLPRVLLEVLTFIKHDGGTWTAPGLATKFGTRVTAMYNRLRTLTELGLLASDRIGSGRTIAVWHALPPAGEPA